MSPEVVFPDPSAPSAVKPFERAGQVKSRGGAVLAAVSCGVWKTTQSSGDAGEVYDYRGVARGPALAAQLIGKQNRLLVVDGDAEYRIVEATDRPTLGYVELALRQVKPNG